MLLKIRNQVLCLEALKKILMFDFSRYSESKLCDGRALYTSFDMGKYRLGLFLSVAPIGFCFL